MGGAGGEKLWHWLHGEDFTDPKLEHQKSLSQSHVLPPELRTPEGAHAVLHKLLHKAAMRLRAARLWAGNIAISVKYTAPRSTRVHSSGIPQTSWSLGAHVVECRDTQTLAEALAKLWAQRPAHTQPFYVGVSLGELVPEHLHTLSLFDEEVRRGRLSAAMDRVNGRYGTHTLGTASMLLAGASAPTRIAFTNLPELF